MPRPERWSAAGQRAIGALHRMLGRLPSAPARACVFGWPDYEENSLVAAVSLARTGRFDVTLLVEDPGAAARYLRMVDPTGAPVRLLRKNSARGVLRASTAGVLLFTHGLYGSPDLTSRKVVVNLWHGIGPKATANATFARRIPFGVMTCNTPVWAAATARALGSPDARLVPSGNPRQVGLRRAPDPAALRRLGLGDRPFVLWMPTHRSSNGVSGPVWRDSVDLTDRTFHGEDLDPISGMARTAREAGVDLVVKPHPLDADDYSAGGLRVVTTKEILAAGTTLYSFIGSSAGLISDYSSVWVEYLDLDRPLLLYCPDISEYVEGRGLNEPYLTEIGQPLIVERAGATRPFFDAVRDGADWRPTGRASLRSALQLPPPHTPIPSPADVVLDELGRRSGPSGG